MRASVFSDLTTCSINLVQTVLLIEPNSWSLKACDSWHFSWLGSLLKPWGISSSFSGSWDFWPHVTFKTWGWCGPSRSAARYALQQAFEIRHLTLKFTNFMVHVRDSFFEWWFLRTFGIKFKFKLKQLKSYFVLSEFSNSPISWFLRSVCCSERGPWNARYSPFWLGLLVTSCMVISCMRLAMKSA